MTGRGLLLAVYRFYWTLACRAQLGGNKPVIGRSALIVGERNKAPDLTTVAVGGEVAFFTFASACLLVPRYLRVLLSRGPQAKERTGYLT
jgi:hypothetical protein